MTTKNTFNTFDLSPLLSQLIGADALQSRLSMVRKNEGFPPHNIEALENDKYLISLAVAGFSKENIEITQEENVLKIVGKMPKQEDERKFLHKGIAERDFGRQFVLGEFIEIEGADIQNGILQVNLKKVVPEHKKPRTIDIGPTNKVIGVTKGDDVDELST